METIEQRAEAGAKFLDNLLPSWYNHIDTSILKMASLDDCILGQLVVKGLMVNAAYDYRLGFDAWTPGEARSVEYDLLRDAWVQEILKRRRAA